MRPGHVAMKRRSDYAVNYNYHDRTEQKLTKRGEQDGPLAGGGASAKKPQRDAIAPGQPAWAKGLQRLYNEVVEEALPDDLARLLDKLDRAADDK